MSGHTHKCFILYFLHCYDTLKGVQCFNDFFCYYTDIILLSFSLPQSQKSTCMKLFDKSAVIAYLNKTGLKWKQHLYNGYYIRWHFISCNLFLVTYVFPFFITLSESMFVLFKVLNALLHSIIDFVFSVCHRLIEKEIEWTYCSLLESSSNDIARSASKAISVTGAH